MKSKYLIMVLAIFILLGVNATFASEHGNETLMMHESALEMSVEETPSEILGENPGSYVDLKKDIDTTPSGGVLELQRDYKFNSTRDTPSASIYTCVPVTKSITIDGRNHIIDGEGCQRGILDITGSNVVLKNIIFKNGYNTGNGGCIYAHGISNFQLINCTFQDSIAGTYGGAVELVSAHNTTIRSCNFINNSAKLSFVPRGGAINWVSSTGGTIADCNFIKNSADYGGAIRMEGVNGVHQYNNYFRDNFASNYGGDIMCDDNNADFHDCNFTNSYSDSYGGSIYWKGSNTLLYNLQFNNVTSKSCGGAITFANCKNVTVKSSSFKKYRSGSGGAIYFMAPECSVVECEFEDGSATSGGAIYTTRDKITVKDSKFKNHTATGYGGVIHISGADAVVDNCEFTDSSSGSNGGIIFVSSSGPGSNISNSKFKSGHATCGGAIYVSAGNVVISGNEFESNTAALGGAVYLGSSLSGISVLDNNFKSNNATQSGGALYSVSAFPELSSNNYTKNSANLNGGALWLGGSGALLNGERFIDNVALSKGGAIIMDTGTFQLNNSYFCSNNASMGSAIFKGSSTIYINNPTFVYNQAASSLLSVYREGNNFEVIFSGFDNILNAIWNNGNLSGIFIDGVNPVKGAQMSNNGELLYEDMCEFDQTITATVLDRDGNVIKKLTQKTNIYGAAYFTIDEGYKVIFAHPEDEFYTGIESVDYISAIKVEKITLTPVVVNTTQVKFQIAVTNSGNYTLHNLVVCEDSFEGLIYAGFEESHLWTNDGLTWTFNTALAPDEVALLTLYFNTTDVGEFTNNVSATASDDVKESASATVRVIPDTFEVKKVSLMPVTKVGEQTIFEIIVHNTGDTDIHNVYIIEEAFEGLIYSHTLEDHLWDYIITSDGLHQWVLKDVLPAHEELGIFVVFNTTEVGNFTNYAIVGHEGMVKRVNATVWVNETVHEPENLNPQLNISIFTVHPVIMLNGEVWFEIIVENTGNIALNNVTVEEFEHDNLEFAGFEMDSGLWDYRPKVLSYENRVDLLGAPVSDNHSWVVNTPLYQNQVLGFFVKFTPLRTGVHENTILGHSAETQEPLYATGNVEVLSEEYRIQKVALNRTVNVGDQVTFQIIVHNTGSVDIGGIQIVEIPDESLIFDHWYCEGVSWESGGPTHYYLLEKIAPGGYSEFFVVYNTTKAGNITNVIGANNEFFNATVEVVNKTDNQTDPDDEPIDDEPIEEEIEDEIKMSDGDSDYGQASSTYSEPLKRTYSAKVDEKATGHPLLALVIVLAFLVLRRRR